MGKPKKVSKFKKTLDIVWQKTKAVSLKLTGWFLNSLYPEGLVCLDCKTELKTDTDKYLSLCASCAERLPFRTQGRTCDYCGCYMDDLAESNCCTRCKVTQPQYDKLISAFDYRGTAKKMVINYKKHGETYLYKYIARYLTDYMNATNINADYFTYVPSTKKTVRFRGFDHLSKVSAELSEKLKTPLIFPLIRVKEAVPQKTGALTDRFENVKGAFDLNPIFDKAILENKTILLLDDVATTGATVNECARVLKDNGAFEVFVLTFARA